MPLNSTISTLWDNLFNTPCREKHDPTLIGELGWFSLEVTYFLNLSTWSNLPQINHHSCLPLIMFFGDIYKAFISHQIIFNCVFVFPTRDENGTDIVRPTDRPKGPDTQMVRPYPNPDI
jgi:hypothetical protein